MGAGVPESEAGIWSRRLKDGSLVLWAIVAVYLAWWTIQYSGFLFDPMLQTDDARTGLFPLHRYGPEGAMADDPIAGGMLAFMPPAVVLLYRILLPFAGLFAAAKIVQGICLGIFAYACVRLARASAAGPASAAIFLFLFLHTTLLFQRGLSGGLPRGFAFPLIALWAAGAMTGSRGDRRAASLIGALTYPSAMIMTLAAEGLFCLRKGIDPRSPELRKRLMHYGILVLVCAVLLVPFFLSKSDAGRIHTLEEAKDEPAFYRDGRLLVLPFRNPVEEFILFYSRPFLPARGAVVEGVGSLLPDSPVELVIPLSFTLLFGLLFIRKRTPFPAAAVAFGLGAMILYALSRVFAFRLYSPERYYSFTMPMVAILLATETAGRLRAVPLRRNLMAAGLVLAVLVLTGDGIVPGKNGMTIDGRDHADLYAFARTLPVDVLFASHPMDGDDLPLWAARSTLGGFETLQPWFVDSWRAQKETTFRTLDALYAVRREDVLAFCREYGVTHLLLNRSRYGDDFARRAAVFQPFDAYLEKTLAMRTRDELVLADPPPAAVVFESETFLVLDVQRLRQAWGPAIPAESDPG